MIKVGMKIFFLITAMIAIIFSYYLKMLIWGVIIVITLSIIYLLIRYFGRVLKSLNRNFQH